VDWSVWRIDMQQNQNQGIGIRILKKKRSISPFVVVLTEKKRALRMLLYHNFKQYLQLSWKQNARSITILAVGFLMGTAIRRFGWKWTTLCCAICCTVIFERNRRVDRRRETEQRALRRIRMQQMWTQDSMLMLIRDAQGVVSPIRPSHLALMLREEDFTAEDYEDLLRLDNEIPRVKALSASEESIARLPVKSIETSANNENCCICLEQLQKGDLAKTMSCDIHTFHAKCLDDWLHVKSTCPLCLTNCS